jgi:hypothetical protein
MARLKSVTDLGSIFQNIFNSNAIDFEKAEDLSVRDDLCRCGSAKIP